MRLPEGRGRWKDGQEQPAHLITAREEQSCLPVSKKTIVLVKYYRSVLQISKIL